MVIRIMQTKKGVKECIYARECELIYVHDFCPCSAYTTTIDLNQRAYLCKHYKKCLNTWAFKDVKVKCPCLKYEEIKL